MLKRFCCERVKPHFKIVSIYTYEHPVKSVVIYEHCILSMFGRFVKHHDTLTLYELTSMLFLLSCSSLIHMFQSSGLGYYQR